MLLNLHITLTYSEQFIRTAQSEQMNYNFNLTNIPDKYLSIWNKIFRTTKTGS